MYLQCETSLDVHLFDQVGQRPGNGSPQLFFKEIFMQCRELVLSRNGLQTQQLELMDSSYCPLMTMNLIINSILLTVGQVVDGEGNFCQFVSLIIVSSHSQAEIVLLAAGFH